MTLVAIGLGLVCIYLATRLHYCKEAGYQQYCEARRLRAELLSSDGRVDELEQLEQFDQLRWARRAGVLN